MDDAKREPRVRPAEEAAERPPAKRASDRAAAPGGEPLVEQAGGYEKVPDSDD